MAKVYRVWVEVDVFEGACDGRTIGTRQCGQFDTVEEAHALQQKLLAAADKE